MRRANGFTLIELIIAMSLTAVLLGLLYNGMDVGIKSWDKGEARADRIDQVRIAQEFLRRQLRQSVTVFRNDEREGRSLYFTGESDRIGWVAPMLRYLGLGGLYYIELEQVGDIDNGALRLRWFPYSPSDEDEVLDNNDVAGETILLDQVTDLKISYFGPSEQYDDEPEWHDEWENLQFRPTLIKLTAGVSDSEWPELLVAVLN